MGRISEPSSRPARSVSPPARDCHAEPSGLLSIRSGGGMERLEEETFVRRRIGTEVEDQLPAVFNAFGPGERDGPALAPRSGGLDPQGYLSSGW